MSFIPMEHRTHVTPAEMFVSSAGLTSANELIRRAL